MHHEPSRWARLLHTLRQPPAYIWLPNLLILGALLATRGWPAATPAQLGAAGLLALLIALADRYPAELAERVALTGAPGLLLAGHTIWALWSLRRTWRRALIFLFAGALIHHIKEYFLVDSDSAFAAEKLYLNSRRNMFHFMKQSSHYRRLAHLGCLLYTSPSPRD